MRVLDQRDDARHASSGSSAVDEVEVAAPSALLRSGIWPRLIRWALVMIRLPAAWRNTSVSRTTGTAPEPMMSARTWPGPTEGSWSTSPTISSAAWSGHRPQQRVHQQDIDHGGLVHDQQIAVERVVLVRAEAARLRVDLQQPVDGLGLQAGGFGQPLGRPSGRGAQQQAEPLATRIFRIELTRVVLPTPGPPVITSTLRRAPAGPPRAGLSASAGRSGARPMGSPCRHRSAARAALR